MDIQAVKPVSSISAAAGTAEKPVARAHVAGVVPTPAGAGQGGPEEGDLGHKLRAVAEQLRAALQSTDRNLEFSVDSDAGTTVITVRDANNGDVIRQIPNEEALRMMRRLNAESGTLVDLFA